MFSVSIRSLKKISGWSWPYHIYGSRKQLLLPLNFKDPIEKKTGWPYHIFVSHISSVVIASQKLKCCHEPLLSINLIKNQPNLFYYIEINSIFY